MEEIKYTCQCERCEAHSTDLGTLKHLEEIVQKNFPTWSIDRQADLIVNWFEKTWKEEMAKEIEKNKKANMAQAQQYKQKNINEMKEG